MGLEYIGAPILPRDPWSLSLNGITRFRTAYSFEEDGAMGLEYIPPPIRPSPPAPLSDDPFEDWIFANTMELYGEFVHRRREEIAAYARRALPVAEAHEALKAAHLQNVHLKLAK